MIELTGVEGSLQPLSLRLEFAATKLREWTPYDKTKIDPRVLKNFNSSNDFLKQETSDVASLLIYGSSQANYLKGHIVGDLITRLNTTFPIVTRLQGTSLAQVTHNLSVFSLKGVLNQVYELGSFTGEVLVKTDSQGVVVGGNGSLNVVHIDLDRSLQSPTTAAVSDAAYYQKSSTTTSHYHWRESVDREMLIAAQVLNLLRQGLDIHSATPSMEYFSNLLNLKLQISASSLEKLWSMVVTLVNGGISVMNWTRALSYVCVETPTIENYTNKSFTIGVTSLSEKHGVGYRLIKNTLVLDLANTELLVAPTELVQVLRQVKPLDLRLVLKLQSESIVL